MIHHMAQAPKIRSFIGLSFEHIARQADGKLLALR
jgi:hypothetical protein